ncbi:MAG: methyltransferase [Anaerolineales bacterium]
MKWFWIGLGIVGLLSVSALWLVRADYQRGDELTPLTVASVWGLYLAHFALELYAALMQFYPIGFAPALLIGLGVILTLAGTVLYALGILHLRSIRRMSGVDTSQLITDGVYSWTRNPQNVGWILFLFGVAFIARSWFALLLAALFAGVFALYVPMEERHLAGIYDESYRRYKAQSHRYLGWPRSDRRA